MKTITLILALFITGTAATYAQCGKKITLTTSKTEHFDSKGNVTRTVDEKATVMIGKTDVNINVNDEHKMAGTIKSDDCNWTVANKEGKKVIKTMIDTGNGEEKNVTITITGKDGKITLLFAIDDEPDDVIRVNADTFDVSDL